MNLTEFNYLGGNMRNTHCLILVVMILAGTSTVSATVQTCSTTPFVNPVGSAEIAGGLRFVFSAPEFGNPLSSNVTYYVLVRVQLSDGVVLKKIGGRTKDQLTPANYIKVALEKDSGAPVFPLGDNTAVRLIRFDDHYFDILFTKNMYSSEWAISAHDTVRIAVGMPAGTVPTDAINNFGGTSGIGTQANTQFECDFSASDSDFTRSPFWEVGFTVYHSDSSGTVGTVYNSFFDPARIPLAQSQQLALKGDLNYDGLVNATDLDTLANYVSGNIDILAMVKQ